MTLLRKPSGFFRLFGRKGWLLSTLTCTIALAGCRLYEPERYTRLDYTPEQKTLRVLMIGDSLTYYNDLPGILQLSTGEAVPVYIEKVTFPFFSLRGHWFFSTARKRIREGHFDYVILQDFSNKPATNPDECLKYFVLFDREIKNAGGKTIIFQNWTRRDLASDYPAMERTYAMIRGQIHADIAPIGAAWRACVQSRPDIKLLLDNRHPTESGSYLTACVLFDILYHERSNSLPLTLPAPNLPPSTLTALRSIADHAIPQ